MECLRPSLRKKAPCSVRCLIKVFLFTNHQCNKKSPSLSRDGLCAMNLMVAQVFNLCAGGVLLSPGGTGFQPVNPLRIIGVAGLNERVRDGIGASH